jgi:hypothetical protein
MRLIGLLKALERNAFHVAGPPAPRCGVNTWRPARVSQAAATTFVHGPEEAHT